MNRQQVEEELKLEISRQANDWTMSLHKLDQWMKNFLPQYNELLRVHCTDEASTQEASKFLTLYKLNYIPFNRRLHALHNA